MVNAKALTITATDRSKSYGDAVTFAGTEFTATAMVGTESVASVTLTSSGAASTATVGGSPYAIVPSAAVAGAGTTLANYDIHYHAGALTVTARLLDITANNDSKTYGQVRSYGAGSTAFNVGAGQLVNGDTVGSVTISDSNSGGAATAAAGGSYPLGASAAVFGVGAASNYDIHYHAGALTVTARLVDITANNDSKTYGQVRSYGAGSTAFNVGAGQLVNGDTVGSVTISDSNSGGAATAAAGGSYPLGASAAVFGVGAASNYDIHYHAGALTVTSRLVDIAANNDSKTYGQVRSYGAGSTAFSVGAGQLVNGDTVGSVTISDSN